MQPDHEVILEVTPGMPLVLSSTSKGDAMKWYQPEHEIFIKANRFDHGREFQDSIAEVIASRLGALLHIPVLEYRLCRIRLEDRKTVLGTVSKNFCRPGESYISFETMVESADEPVQWGVSAKENYSLVLDWFTKMTGLDARPYLDTMLVFDYLICNEDRHLNNFGVLKNMQDNSYRFPPLFDNGYALGFMQAEYKPVEQYLYACKAKPFSTSFSKQLHLVENLPAGLILPESVPDTLFVDLPMPEVAQQYCREIIDTRLKQLKEHFG